MNWGKYSGLLLLTISLLFFGACKSATEPTPEPPVAADSAAETEEAIEPNEEANQAAGLYDTAWTVQSFGGEDPVPSVPGSLPTVNYLGTRYSGYTGCNFYLGVYGVDDEVLRMNTPAVTRGACADNQLQGQQDYFLSLLANTTRHEIIDGNLLLYSIDTLAMTLEPLEPLPFEGTIWQFEFLNTGKGAWIPILPGTSVTAVFDGDTISGSSGCNEYTGTVTRDGQSASIGGIAVTNRMCTEPEGVMEQEARYLEQLETTGNILVYTRSFELFNTEKEPIMLFAADVTQ